MQLTYNLRQLGTLFAAGKGMYIHLYDLVSAPEPRTLAHLTDWTPGESGRLSVPAFIATQGEGNLDWVFDKEGQGYRIDWESRQGGRAQMNVKPWGSFEGPFYLADPVPGLMLRADAVQVPVSVILP